MKILLSLLLFCAGLFGQATPGFIAGASAVATVASASTIAPVAAINVITGATPISTLTPPPQFTATGLGGCLYLFNTTGTWTLTTGGNIAVALTPSTNTTYYGCYTAVSSTWLFGPVGGNLVPAFTTLTDGATVTWTPAGIIANAGLTFTVHGGSRTLNLSGPLNGASYVLWLKQDSTGGEGLILGTGCAWKVIGGGSGAITPSTTANAVDVLAFTYDGTNCYATFGKNYN